MKLARVLGLALVLTGFAFTPVWAEKPAEEDVLFASPPPGWIPVLNEEGAGSRISEFVPEGQTQETWDEKITIQVVEGLTEIDPREFTDRIQEGRRKLCPDLLTHEPNSRDINGYNVTVVRVECRDTKVAEAPEGLELRKIEFLMMKIIMGKQNLYIIQRAWHGKEPGPGYPFYSETDAANWSAFFRQAEVCAPNDPTASCGALGLLSHEQVNAWAINRYGGGKASCPYYASLTAKPVMGQPVGAGRIAPIRLGKAAFGAKSEENRLIEAMAGLTKQNAPMTLILSLSDEGVVDKEADYKKVKADIEFIEKALIDKGVAKERIVIRRNANCK